MATVEEDASRVTAAVPRPVTLRVGLSAGGRRQLPYLLLAPAAYRWQ